MVVVRSRSVEAILKVERALAIAARARVRRHISSDPAAPYSTGTIASSERSIVLRDVRGRFVQGHAGGPGRPPRDCLREAFTSDLLAVYRRHGKQALRQLCEENPAAYLRLIAGLFASKR
jgi:hypothetical protein